MTPAELKVAREALGLSLTGLAKALRMGRNGRDTIRAWEADDNIRGVPGPAQVAVEALLKEQTK
jgi:DNA-binding transcriptional regulator YiaG